MIFSPLEAIFAPLIDPLVDLIGLPDIGFSVSVRFEDLMPGNAALCMCVVSIMPCRRLDDVG